MFDIRLATEADRGALASLLGLAFNSRRNPEDIALDGRLSAYDGERPVATARAITYDQWFGGERAPCVGVGGVAVLPEYRGKGLASAVMSALLHQERANGRAVSVLYPTAPVLYRRLGYEFGGVRLQFRAPITDLPAGGGGGGGRGGGGEVRRMEETDLDQVMNCFSRFASRHNGPVQSPDRAWWQSNVLTLWSTKTQPRAVVAHNGGALTGYASYFLEPWAPDGSGEESYKVVCNHLVFNDARALGALLGYFRAFENSAKELAWYGPPSSAPVGLAIGSNGFSVKADLTRWMTRVVDVPLALRSRGYPQISGTAVLAIDDNLFPENAGPWLVRADAGRVSIERAGEGRAAGAGPVAGQERAGKPLPIGLFSALYTGFATAGDLVLVGALEGDDERLPFLSALFAGPVPWMPDFF